MPRVTVGVALWLSFCIALGLTLRDAQAETNAEKVFGRWEKITVEDIRKPVPEVAYTGSPSGSVTNEYRRPRGTEYAATAPSVFTRPEPPRIGFGR
jgi:hypothetical protein